MRYLTNEQQQAAYERLAAKLQAFEGGLAEDEHLLLDLAIRRIAAGDKSDTSGFRAAQYDDEGYKGPPGTAPLHLSGVCGRLAGPVLTFSGLLIGALFGSQTPGQYPS
jgi:hypothetical protein